MWELLAAFLKAILLPTVGYLLAVGFSTGVRRVRVFQSAQRDDSKIRWDDHVYGHALILPSAFLLYPVVLELANLDQTVASVRWLLAVVGAAYLYIVVAVLMIGYAAVRGPLEQALVASSPSSIKQRRRANVAGVIGYSLTLVILFYLELRVVTSG